VISLSIPDTLNLRPSCVYVAAARLTSSMQVKRCPQDLLQARNHENRWRQKCELYEEMVRAFAEGSKSTAPWAPVPWTVGHCQYRSNHPLAKKTADNIRAQKMGELLGLPSGPTIRTAANVHNPPTRLATDNHETATCSASRAMGLVIFRRSRKIAKSKLLASPRIPCVRKERLVSHWIYFHVI